MGKQKKGTSVKWDSIWMEAAEIMLFNIKADKFYMNWTIVGAGIAQSA
jgi:hypothetical protein